MACASVSIARNNHGKVVLFLVDVANRTQTTIKPVKRKIGSKERSFIQFCEVYYFKNDFGFPTVEFAASELGYNVSEIQTMLLNVNVQKALDRRGIPWKRAGKFYELTPTQVATAISIANFGDTRSEDQILTDLGVTPQQYYSWLHDPVYRDYVNKLADRNLEYVRPTALTNFAKLVREGDLPALRYYFEVTGEFEKEGLGVEQLQAFIQVVLESVQKHVKDPEILKAIAGEIKTQKAIEK